MGIETKLKTREFQSLGSVSRSSSRGAVFFYDLTEIFDFVVGQISHRFKSVICQNAIILRRRDSIGKV